MKIEAAMRRLEAQAKADAEAERQRRGAAEAQPRRTGTPRRGNAPQPVQERPDDKAQSHLTDPAWPSMRSTNKGWDDCGNAPARVDGACQIIVACDVTDATNDKQQAEPMAQATRMNLAQAGIESPKDESGAVQPIPATLDNGYDRDAAGAALETLGCDPYLATGRQEHHAPQTEGPEEPATAQERMAAQRRTPAGQALYPRRKVMVEPVCGQIKAARGFRRFLRRGLATIRGAWRRVCLTHHLRKIWRDGRVLSAVEVVGRPVDGLARALVRTL